MIVSDDVLINSFRDGNDLAFVSLYNRYKRAIHVFCVKIVLDVDAAKDIVKEVFLKVFEQRAELRHPERFRSWLFSIARNDCITHLRKRSSTAMLADGVVENACASTTSNDDVDRTEAVTLVNRAIQQLKPDLREVVVLREYNNLSYREIAEVIGATESIVKSRLFTARQRLYDILKPIYTDRRES